MKRTSIIGIAIAAASLLCGAPAMAAAAEVNLDNIVLQKTNTSQIAGLDASAAPQDDMIVMVDLNQTDGGALILPVDSDDSLTAAAAPNILGSPTLADIEKMTLASGGALDSPSSSGLTYSSMTRTNLTAGADFIGLTSPVFVT